MKKPYAEPILNNPLELGGEEIGLLIEALEAAVKASSGVKALSFRNLLDEVKDSYSVWLDKNE